MGWRYEHYFGIYRIINTKVPSTNLTIRVIGNNALLLSSANILVIPTHTHSIDTNCSVIQGDKGHRFDGHRVKNVLESLGVQARGG
jgi:hypothetical protein